MVGHSLLVLFAVAAGGTPAPTKALGDDGCLKRRADIEAVRAADAEALVALRRRLDAEVATLPAGRARGCAAAVAAEAAILAGDKDNTLAFLDVLVAFVPEVAADVRPHRALLLAEVGRSDDAKAELALLNKKSAWYDRVAAALATGDEQRALWRRRGARDRQAVAALCADGDARQCATLVVNWPADPAARAIEDRVAATLSRPQAIARAKALHGVARPARAVTEAQAIFATMPPDAAGSVDDDELRELIANALWRLDRTAEALPFVDGYQALLRDGRGVGRARAAARTFARLGKNDDASAAWAAVRDTASAPDDIRQEAAFFAGFVFVDADDIPAATAAFDAGSDVMRDTRFDEAAEWYRALLDLSVKNDLVAVEARLAALLARTPAPSEPRKLQYWRAHALRGLGRAKEADAVDRALMTEAPLDWYGLLARQRLGLAPLKGAVVGDVVPMPRKLDESAQAAQLLFTLGFDDEARERCRGRAQGKKVPSLDDVAVCQAVHDPTFGWRRNGHFAVSPEVKGGALSSSSRWRVSYARPWRAVVDAEATRAGTAPSFAMAIMRTESGFDPSAVSVAGARGLMQLLPSTARTTATATARPTTLAERLNDVDASVALGAGLLGLLSREHGSMLMAAAAYNAGSDAAASWAKRFVHLPPALFVERISFKETRNYVKKVLAAEALYRGLDGGDVTLALPATIAPPPATYTTFPYDE